MNTATNHNKPAATLEAEPLTQPDALHTALAALRELHSVCVLMDHPDQMKRPTEDEYQAAMAGAVRVLGRH